MMFFYFLFILILLLDALSLSGVKAIEYLLILQAPIFLFLLDFLGKKTIKIPKKFFILQFLFLIFFIIANIFSSNRDGFIYGLGLYTALILISIYSYNHKEELKSTLKKLIIVLSLVFVVMNFFKPQLIKLIPFFALNNSHLISYTSLTHNHLGDFLVLPLAILIIEMLNKVTRAKLLFFVIIFVSYIFSYSRSAYLSLITTLILLIYFIFRKFSLNKKTVIIVSLLISTLFLFFSPVLTRLSFKERGEKNFFGYREIYYKKAIEGFIKKPFFGWGAGNYSNINYVDKQHLEVGSAYSHNIFLDMLSENGIFTFVAFLLMIAYGLFYGEKNLYYYLFIALLINFQTDFTYTIIPFFWLFFINLGLIIK